MHRLTLCIIASPSTQREERQPRAVPKTVPNADKPNPEKLSLPSHFRRVSVRNATVITRSSALSNGHGYRRSSPVTPLTKGRISVES